MRTIKAGKRRVARSALLVIATIALVISLGAVASFAQAAKMNPPSMVPGASATVGLTWDIVDPIGVNPTTYKITYDTVFPFSGSPHVVITNDVSYVIDGVNGTTYYATIQADDGSGVYSDASDIAEATADGVPPLSALVVAPASPNGSNGWYKSAVATITVSDAISGLQSLTVNGVDVSADANLIFGFPPDPSYYPVTLVQGVNTFTMFGVDVAGNVESPEKVATVKLDSVAPGCALSVSTSAATSQTVTASITSSDTAPGSGMDHVEYVFLPRGTSPDGATVWTSVAGASASPTVPQGRLTLFARSVDVAGNVSAMKSADVFFDSTLPVTALVTNPASPTGPSGSWMSAPTITLNVTDTDPAVQTFYSWNDVNVTTPGTHPTVPTGAGTKTLRYFSVDSAGNAEAVHMVNFLVQDQQTYTVTPGAGAGGSISPATQQSVAGGSNLHFTITPDPDFHILDVLVDGSSVGAVTSWDFTSITANHTISASFTAMPTFVITPTAGAHGSISPAAPQTVISGHDATFTITPDPDYVIDEVLVDGVPVGAVSSFTFHNVTTSHTISASFVSVPSYAITPSAGLHGSISPATAQSVLQGHDATFTVTPDPGYHIKDVLVDGVPVGAVSSYTFHGVTSAHTISATFEFTKLRTVLSIHANHTSVTRGHRVYFYGYLWPSMPNGTHVSFWVKKPGSSTWVKLSTRNTYSRKWTYSYVPKSRGYYYFQARFGGTSKYLPSVSPTIRVRAR